MRDQLSKIKAIFISNMELVESLLSFDEVIQKIALVALNKAQRGLQNFDLENHPSYKIAPLIEQVEKIRDHGSVRHNYEIMLNQCVVLQVSYFSSVLEDLFREALSIKIKEGDLGSLASEEIKITIAQIQNDEVVDVILEKKDISFQDMQSILRSFNRYIGMSKIDKDENVDNIILAQAMRHSIVHSGCIVSKKTEIQLNNATKRTIKKLVNEGDTVQFSEDEVGVIKKSMLTFMACLLSKLSN